MVHRANCLQWDQSEIGVFLYCFVPTLKSGPDKALRLSAVIHWAHSLEWEHVKRETWTLYSGSANNPNSEIAGHTEACVTRSRTRDVVIRGPLINRQLPTLVAVANSTH